MVSMGRMKYYLRIAKYEILRMSMICFLLFRCFASGPRTTFCHETKSSQKILEISGSLVESSDECCKYETHSLPLRGPWFVRFRKDCHSKLGLCSASSEISVLFSYSFSICF